MNTSVLTHARGTSLQRNDGTGACYVCDHGKTGACLCPAVRGNRPSQAFAEARRPHGSCGPEAIHMDFPGLYWPGDRR